MTENKARRHPITIRLTNETIQLARNLAKLYMEDEKKLGQMIEETILFYSANRENQSRTNALLKVTEDNLLNQFREQVESMYREFKTRDKLLAERVASLLAIQGFESCLTELMLKDLYSKNSEREQRYEELRSVAARKMKDRYDKSDIGKMVQLTEKITELENKIQKNNEMYSSQVSNLKEELSCSHRKNNRADETIQKQKNHLKSLQEEIQTQKRLIDWYEKRDNVIPKLQEQNKNKLGMKQSYEKAKLEFEQNNSKPKI